VQKNVEDKPISLSRTLERLQRGEAVTIVSYGDSNSAVTFQTRGHMNWVGLLEEALFEKYGSGSCILINSSRCGVTYRDGLARLDSDVIRFRPDLVILSFGMNDATRGLQELPSFRSEVRDILLKIRELTDAEILIRTPNPVVVHGVQIPAGQRLGRSYQDSRLPVKEYSQALVELADELRCPVVDHYSLWCAKKFTCEHPEADPTGLWPRMSDPTHPGAVGHLAFFREMASVFEVSPFFPWEER